RGRPTALTPYVLEHFGIARPQELVHAIYHRNLRPSAIAAVSHTVQRAAAAGDELALAILSVSARDLADSAAAVVRQLERADTAFSFGLAGGLLQAGPRVGSDLQGRLKEVAPRSSTILLAREPAMGAVTLALAEANGVGRLPTYRQS